MPRMSVSLAKAELVNELWIKQVSCLEDLNLNSNQLLLEILVNQLLAQITGRSTMVFIFISEANRALKVNFKLVDEESFDLR